jgi:hypothetical protein
MENYDNKCDIHFVTKINDKYLISFYSDDDNKKFIILKNNNKLLWCKYKLLCSYDIKKNILKKGSDMIIIEKSIIDDKLNYKTYKNIDDLEKHIMNNILNYYIGYIVKQDKNIVYFFGIEKIIRF